MQHAVEQAIASLQAVLAASAEVSGPAAHSSDRSAEVHLLAVIADVVAQSLASNQASFRLIRFRKNTVSAVIRHEFMQVYCHPCSHGTLETMAAAATVWPISCESLTEDLVMQVCKARELRLIQNQHLILSPPVKVKVKPLELQAG